MIAEIKTKTCVNVFELQRNIPRYSRSVVIIIRHLHSHDSRQSVCERCADKNISMKHEKGHMVGIH